MKKLTLFFFMSDLLYSQETIQLDRPDQTETVAIVPKNYLQAEAGFLFEKVNTNESNYSLPSVLWKYGLNNIVELRLITEYSLSKDGLQNPYKLEPISIGFKTHLMEEKGIIPEISFIGHLSYIKNLTTERKNAVPSFRFTLQNTLSENTSLGYNLGIEWDETHQETYIYTLTVGSTITQKMSYYLEAYGFFNTLKTADQRIDGGFLYVINKDFVIDFSGGIGLSKISPKYFMALGISYRMNLGK